MNAEAAFCFSAAIMVVAVASCTAATNYTQTERRKNLDPQTACVERALTQADRIECLKTVPPSTRSGK